MNDKTFHINFESLADAIQDAKKAIKQGKVVGNPGREASFENFSSFMSFMFPNKFALLIAIKLESPKSLYQLAQVVDRPQSAVLKDCDELENMGFIIYDKGSRNSKIPKLSFDYDTLLVHDRRGLQKYQFINVA